MDTAAVNKHTEACRFRRLDTGEKTLGRLKAEDWVALDGCPHPGHDTAKNIAKTMVKPS